MLEPFLIRLGEFEGPLDLILQLIEKKKMHVSQINLAKVTDDYIAYIAGAGTLPKQEIVDFLVIASTLMLIKSVSLLPNLSLAPEEEASALELEYRLKLYQYMQKLGSTIKEHFNAEPIFWREPGKNIVVTFSPTHEITTSNLSATALKLLSNLSRPSAMPKLVVKKVMSLQEVMEKLTERISQALSVKFSDFIPPDRSERINVIVSFLGMLELVKQGIIEVEQSNHFQDIRMQTLKPGLPRY